MRNVDAFNLAPGAGLLFDLARGVDPVKTGQRAGGTDPLSEGLDLVDVAAIPVGAIGEAADRIDAALALLRQSLDWDRALRRLDELNARVEDPTLWGNAKQAQDVMRERTRLDSAIGATRAIEAEKTDNAELIEMAEAEGDEDMVAEAIAALKALADRADEDKIKALLAGEADASDTYLEIHAGAGGTESQDWAEILSRMYRRWAERRGYKVELVDYQAGETAGIKSATSRAHCCRFTMEGA